MDNVTGRPWKNIARFSVFEDADNKRSELIKIWETNNTQGMQKSTKRNKKNSDRGKFDASSSV